MMLLNDLNLGGNVVPKNALARDIRVVNGEDATAGEFPFLVIINFYSHK